MDNTTTLKVTVPSDMDEMRYLELKYSETAKALLEDPQNEEKRKAFEDANKALWETKDAYRIARKLILQRKEEQLQADIRTYQRQQVRRDGNRIFLPK